MRKRFLRSSKTFSNTYRTTPHAIPWEKKPLLAGKTGGMTQLQSCARGKMWEDYDPTPMTEEWLIKWIYSKYEMIL